MSDSQVKLMNVWTLDVIYCDLSFAQGCVSVFPSDYLILEVSK